MENKKLTFFQSIHFKIALVFALLLLITFQIVGAIFVQQIKSDNLKSFKQRVELSSYVDNLLTTNLSNQDTKKANAKIKEVLGDVNNANISQVQVVDAKGNIRADSDVSNRALIGQKTANTDIKQVLYSGQAYSKTTYSRDDDKRYYISITPLYGTGGNINTIVGVVYLKANLESVYSSVNSVTVTFATAALFATVIGMGLAIVVSRAITRPIDEMKKQTQRIANGDYIGQVHVYGNDELGQLSKTINNLSIRVKDAQESSEAERRRLDSVLAHMSEGVIATDRSGRVNIINEAACEALNIEDVTNVMGQSILDVLDIRNQYTMRVS